MLDSEKRKETIESIDQLIKNLEDQEATVQKLVKWCQKKRDQIRDRREKIKHLREDVVNNRENIFWREWLRLQKPVEHDDDAHVCKT